ncbi:transcriptional regulator, AraC family [Algoriphagus ornithinivorans]|uniref:Transcriptional regulator, AraC family n=1 Tax=Algoriphagus ornithinivorans TaxID=226506 RepID=A0A1I5DNX0_9BACT|nr:AraC family transcriptional regulator [Algoriphagus ornithinivorans]SFO00942.1 transcriptional regulator, AraC family [Algoriphagus ornithinivorans]
MESKTAQSGFEEMIFNGPTGEFLQLECIPETSCTVVPNQGKSELAFLWILEKSELIIDGACLSFEADQILCLTEFHKLSVKSLPKARLVRFNRPFFCILDHDSEVGCKGILFYGSSKLPVIELDAENKAKLEALWGVFQMEIREEPDSLQLEMLQMLLKRMLILCTRLYSQQAELQKLDHQKSDLIREFNFFVEMHFRSKHQVADYAELLFKSPKTISNAFSKLGAKSPLSYIHDRIILEGRRLLGYTDKPISEIGYELGFEDVQSFSRFFKNNEGLSPSDFRENLRLGKIANSSGKTD